MTPRLAFVVSSDYSELGMAVGAARSAGVEARVYLPRHQQALAASFPGQRLRLFDGTADLLTMLTAFKPTHLLLFSGYLFLHPSGPDLAALLQACSQLRHPPRVATTDPFLGLLQDQQALAQPAFQAALQRLPGLLPANARAVQACTHLYPGPVAALDGPASRQGYRLVDAPAAVAPTWLFVLGELEAQALVKLHGASQVVNTLLARAQDACAAGKRPCLYLPRPLADAVAAAAAGRLKLDSRPHGEHGAFNAEVDSAEQAFYWNWSSSSLVRRLTAGLPVSFFGRGHVSQLLPGIAERLMAHFYTGGLPPVMAWDQPLQPADLAAVQAASRADREALAQRYRALPRLPDLLLSLP